MSNMLVDFHCHLDLYPDYRGMFKECDREGVYTLAVTTPPKAWPHNQKLAETTSNVRAALGLHPQLVAERAEEISLWEEYLPRTRYVGEVGLDAGPRFYRTFDLQKRVFERILLCCAVAGDKIISVHCVRAATVMLDLIESTLPVDRGRVILHWFSGSRVDARRAVKLGCYFSINMEMLRTQRHRELVAGLPLERILTETDGPFTKFNQQASRPRDVIATIQAIAHARNLDNDTVLQAVLRNLQSLDSSWW